MIKFLTIIGARPQIIKASALDRAIKGTYSKDIRQVILHTGQHYDDTMSDVFFREMDITQPDYNLKAGSGNHGKQTATMIEGIEEIAAIEKPAVIVVYGDTNSTLAAAVAATKLKIPLVHIEAGLRSFNKTMPEEINRVVCDHCSTMLFTPTLAGYNNLIREGFNPDNESPFTINKPGILHCGDVMYDNTLYFSGVAEAAASNLIDKLGITNKDFLLLTIHRDSNTDIPERLNAILEAINEISISEQIPVVFPVHPRTSASLDKNKLPILKDIKENLLFKMIHPSSFLEMILLEKRCSMVLTDSGGVQKEAFFLHKPCIVLRPETEWVELIECGNSILAGADGQRIKKAYSHFKEKKKGSYPLFYGEGNAADFICKEIIRNFR